MITKTRSYLSAILLILCSAFAPVQAAGDPEAGSTLGYSCLGCHGIEGYRNAYPSFRVPKLGGQKAAYLEVALRGYRNGTRKHPTMVAQASSLTDKEIQDVAAYLASLGNDTVEAGGSDAQSFELTTTCIACHGQNGISLSPTWPTLAGQHEDYLVYSLKQYRDGARSDAVMMPLATNLTDQDIERLAAFYASLEGLETTEAD